MFEFSDTSSYMMPAHFGGTNGPPRAWTYAEVTTIGISYETDRERLARYVPEDFEIAEPVVALLYAMNRGVEWMAGGSYNLIAVNVPVVYRRGPRPMEGEYALVVWENKTCPIIGGREQTGIPKIFASIEDHRQIGDRWFTVASYEGSTFLAMDARKTAPMRPDELRALNVKRGMNNWFGWRYIPNVGRPGAALSHAVLYPIAFTFTAAWRAEGTVRWQRLTPEQNPTQFHVIDALAELPIKGYRGSMIAVGSEVLRADIARPLP